MMSPEYEGRHGSFHRAQGGLNMALATELESTGTKRCPAARWRADLRRHLLSCRVDIKVHVDYFSTSHDYGGDLASTGTVKPLLRAQVLSPGKTLGKNHNCQH